MGILSDTKNATSNVSEMDRLAYQDLIILSGVEDVDVLYKGMEEAAANYDGKYFIFKEYQSRKKKIIPALTAALEKMNAMGAADLTDTGEEAAEEEAMEPAA